MADNNPFQLAVTMILSLDPTVVEITVRSLMVSGAAVLLSALFALPIGTLLAIGRFPGRRALDFIATTMIAFPAVLVGLIGSQMLGHNGPLSFLGWLFTVQGMILAQAVLVMPLLIAFTRGAVGAEWERAGEGLLSLGFNRITAIWPMLIESRFALVTVMLAGFGRAIAEVGTANMIGGNLLGDTRVLTTAIMQETQRGDFALANALGLVLLALAIGVNLVGRVIVNALTLEKADQHS